MRRRTRWGHGVAVCMREVGACGTGGHGPETVRVMVRVHLLGDGDNQWDASSDEGRRERHTGRRSACTGARLTAACEAQHEPLQ